jgi:hypothetical protein
MGMQATPETTEEDKPPKPRHPERSASRNHQATTVFERVRCAVNCLEHDDLSTNLSTPVILSAVSGILTEYFSRFPCSDKNTPHELMSFLTPDNLIYLCEPQRPLR